MSEAKEWTTDQPNPQPTRYRMDFTKEEVKSALLLYLYARGVNIPADGDVYLYGLEKKVYGLDDEKATLVIDVYEGGTENA